MTPSVRARMAATFSAVDAGADEERQVGRGADLVDLLDGRGIAGALAGGDHRVGVEEGEVAGQLADRAVGGDRMGAVLDVGVGEDLDVLGAQRGAVAHRLGRARPR